MSSSAADFDNRGKSAVMGDRDEGVRQHEDGEGHRVDRRRSQRVVRRSARPRGGRVEHPLGDEEPELGHREAGEGPDRESADAAKADATQPPARAIAEPARYSAGSSQAAWAMTETVADPAKSQIIGSVHWSGGRARLALGVDDLGCREDGDEHEQAGNRDDVGDERCPTKPRTDAWRSGSDRRARTHRRRRSGAGR